MAQRSPVPANFRPVCEATIPADARAASVEGQSLTLPKRESSKVLVLGDTGCRLEGARIQACNDPEAWPFRKVASLAAAEKPELVIHVGDYLYRESACPATAADKCGGTVWGDNWDTWREDFFAPAADLLRAAPWALVRGNHESCARAWRGWHYYLDPGPWTGSCADVSPAYTIQSVDPPIVMFDTAIAADNNMPVENIEKLTKELARVSDRKGWLAVHHPFWGVRLNTNTNRADAGNIGLQRTWEQAAPKGIDMILAGHTHLFELLTFDTLPIQIVAGIGGTQLAAPLPRELSGIAVGNSMVMTGEGRTGFGYLLFNKRDTNWDLTLKSVESQIGLRCTIQGRAASCADSK